MIGDAGFDSAENCSYVLYELNALPIIKMRLRRGRMSGVRYQHLPMRRTGRTNLRAKQQDGLRGRDGAYLKWRWPAAVECRQCKCNVTENCSTSDYGRVLKVKIAEDPRRFPGLSRDSIKWKRLYRKRSACQRVNGSLKNYLLLDGQHVRGKAKVSVQVGMSLLVMLASAISMAKLDKLESVRRIVALAA